MWALYAKCLLDAIIAVERVKMGHVDQALMFAGFLVADVGALWIAIRSAT